MVQHTMPQIEVTISPALRAIYATRGKVVAEVNAEAVASQDTHREAQREPARGQTQWHRLRLRRDGKRPLEIEGMHVATCAKPVRLGHAIFDHRLDIYISKEETIYISMALHPPTDVPVRPVYAAEVVGDPPLDQVMSQWNDQVDRVSAFVTLSSS